MSGYENDPEFVAWAKRIREQLVPMMENCAVVTSILCDPKNVDAKFAVELGIAVMLNKPIIALVRPGIQIPEKLARVVDRFVEFHPGDELGTMAGLREAIEAIRPVGLTPPSEPRP